MDRGIISDDSNRLIHSPSHKYTVEPKKSAKTWFAAGSFPCCYWLALSGFSIYGFSFLTGEVLMVLTTVMSIPEAYESLEWKVVFMLFGLIPLGAAMQKQVPAHFLDESVRNLVDEGNTLVCYLPVAVPGLPAVFRCMSTSARWWYMAPLVVNNRSDCRCGIPGRWYGSPKLMPVIPWCCHTPGQRADDECCGRV